MSKPTGKVIMGNFTRNNKKYVNEANKHINRRTVLSSSNPKIKLPSAKGSMRLKALCDEALKWLDEVHERWKQRSDIVSKSELLKKKYKNDQEALLELPHILLNDRKLKVLNAEMAEARACYIALAGAYEKRTGKKHGPNASEKVNNPLVIVEQFLYIVVRGNQTRVKEMARFTLIGYPTLIFTTVWRGSYFDIDCVKGITLDGKRQTFARVADVEENYV